MVDWSFYDKKKREFVALRMPKYLLIQLQEQAKQEETTLSEIIRRKLEEEKKIGKLQEACI